MTLQKQLAILSFVELEGFEPSSKRGTNKLSTCLVVDLQQASEQGPLGDVLSLPPWVEIKLIYCTSIKQQERSYSRQLKFKMP